MAAKKGAEAPVPLEDVVRNLSGSKKRLDALDDVVSSAIRNVETLLRVHVGTRIESLMYSGEGEYTVLAFTKINGKWMLAIENGMIDRDDDEPSRTPLASASREMRSLIFANGHVEALIRTAHEQITKQMLERTTAIEHASVVLDALRSLGEVEAEAEVEPAQTFNDDLPF